VDQDTGRSRRTNSLLASGSGAPRPRARADATFSPGVAANADAAFFLGLSAALAAALQPDSTKRHRLPTAPGGSHKDGAAPLSSSVPKARVPPFVWFRTAAERKIKAPPLHSCGSDTASRLKLWARTPPSPSFVHRPGPWPALTTAAPKDPYFDIVGCATPPYPTIGGRGGPPRSEWDTKDRS